MHRDEAIYARADARAITLTADEAALCVGGLRLIERQAALPQSRDAARVLAARLSAASTTPSP